MRKIIGGILCAIGALFALDSVSQFHYASLGDMAPSLVIGIAFIYGGLSLFEKDRIKTREREQGKPQSVKPPQQEPNPEVLKIIQLYKEMETDRSIDKEERIWRCNCLLTEYKWHVSHKEDASWLPNVRAMWKAVCEYDAVYEGSRYERQLMSDICLKLQEQYRDY